MRKKLSILCLDWNKAQRNKYFLSISSVDILKKDRKQKNKTCPGLSIVYVWSQHDGSANIEQWTIGYGWRQYPEAKLKIVGGVILRSNQQEADPTSSYITSVIVS